MCEPNRIGSAPRRVPARSPMRLPTGSMRTASPACCIRSIAKPRPAMSASLNATRVTPPCGFAPKRPSSSRWRYTRSLLTRQLFQSPCGNPGPTLLSAAAVVRTKARRFTLSLLGSLGEIPHPDHRLLIYRMAEQPCLQHDLAATMRVVRHVIHQVARRVVMKPDNPAVVFQRCPDDREDGFALGA